MSCGTLPPLPPSVILFPVAATSGSTGLCFRVMSSKWSLQVRPKIKRIIPQLSAEKSWRKEKDTYLSYLSSYSTGPVLESTRYLLQSLQSSAFSIVWPCWPQHATKAPKDIDPAAHKLNEFWGHSSCSKYKGSGLSSTCKRRYFKPQIQCVEFAR